MQSHKKKKTFLLHIHVQNCCLGEVEPIFFRLTALDLFGFPDFDFLFLGAKLNLNLTKKTRREFVFLCVGVALWKFSEKFYH